MEQKYFKDSWLLPCSLRSHRIANPRPKMGIAIFRLCPPAALKGERITTKNTIEYYVYLDKLKKHLYAYMLLLPFAWV